MSFQRLGQLSQGGVALGLAGGLIALIPTVETLLYAPQGWTGPLVMTLAAAAVLGGAALAVRDHQALGGAIAGVSGAVLVFFGPTTGGALALIGGSILFLEAGRERSGTGGSQGRGGSSKL